MNWSTEQLPTLVPNEVRFSRGFLSCEPLDFFPTLAEHWTPLFHMLGADVQFVKLEKSLYFPPDLARIVVCEVGGESAVIGMDEAGIQLLSKRMIGKNLPELSSEILIEYFERRLLTALTKSWVGAQAFPYRYLSSDWAEEVEVIGAIEVELSLNNEKLHLWFGLGPRLTEEFDAQWRRNFRKSREAADESFSDGVRVVTMELAQLAVPPALLIDYMRTGTTIEVACPLSSEVTICVDGVPWANGVLCQLNGMFAVRVLSMTPPELTAQEGTTRISVEVARTDIEESSLAEYHQEGAILTTSHPARNMATLVINNEAVATALVGELDDHLTLSILSR